MKYSVNAYYGVVKTYSKVFEIEAESESEAEEIAEQLINDCDGIDDSWDIEEGEIQWGDFGFEIEES